MRYQSGNVGFLDSPNWDPAGLQLYGGEFINMDMGNLFGVTYICPVNLTECVFSNCTFHYSLIKFDGTSGPDLVMSGCTFTDVEAKESIAVWNPEASGSSSGKCVIEECRFESVAGSSQALLRFTCFAAVSVTNTHFINNDKLGNGPLAIGSIDWDGNLTLDSVYFEKCVIEIADGTTDPRYACVHIDGGTIDRMNNLTFVSCAYSRGDQPILKITASLAMSDPVNVYFDGCSSTNTHLVLFDSSDRIAFGTSTFQNMELTSAVVGFVSSTEVAFKDVMFSNVKTSADLLVFEQSPTKLEFDNVTVDGSKFTKLADAGSANILFQDCNFRQNNAGSNLLDSKGTSVELLGCIIDEFVCESSLIALSGCTTVNISLTAFKDCSCKSGSLVTITDAGSVFIGSSCFQGSPERTDGAAYIDCTCQDATFELPMCFNLSQEASISFKGTTPLDNISDPSAIFNCRNCSFIPDYDSLDDSDSIPAEKGNGLSGGAIAGIVIGVLIVVAAVVLVILFFILKQKKSEEKSLDDDPDEMNQETVDVTVTSIISEEWNEKVTEDQPMFTNVTGVTNDVHDQDPFTINDFEEAFC